MVKIDSSLQLPLFPGAVGAKTGNHEVGRRGHVSFRQRWDLKTVVGEADSLSAGGAVEMGVQIGMGAFLCLFVRTDVVVGMESAYTVVAQFKFRSSASVVDGMQQTLVEQECERTGDGRAVHGLKQRFEFEGR